MRLRICLFTAGLLFLVGCGASSAASFTREDLILSIDDTQYSLDMPIEEVIAAVGQDYEYAEAMSCDYDGLDKTYQYGIAKFFTNPLAAGDMVAEIYTESPEVLTSKEIAVGSSRTNILAAYGENCEDMGDLLIYRVEGERTALCFELENDVVWAIYLTNQSV